MNNERDTLRRIEALPEPRHLFILPSWADPAVVDQLIADGYLVCQHQQRDDRGRLLVAMGLHLTPKGNRLIHPIINLQKLAFKGSLAGASFAVMSVVILYLG
jgi:hypothetical protein